MLADAKSVDAELIGQHRLIHHVADDLGVAQQGAIGAGSHIAESIETKLEICCHGCRQFVLRA